jgi:hypothetical protein
MNLLVWMVGRVFGCRHKKMSRIFTINNRTYSVCFDCGQEFNQPKVLAPSVRPKVAA